MSKASTRRGMYSRIKDECGCSEGSIRTAACRAGLTSSSHSLKCAFSMEEERALVDACIMYARQGKPFTIRHFCAVASYFAGKFERKDFFSRGFAQKFLKRHIKLLQLKEGKLTSPTRCTKTMVEKTEAFIAMMNKIMETNSINNNNMVVFDETVIGDNGKLLKVIGERRKSDGGNNHVVQTRESILGSYIPFSMVDGTTPFRVFIFKSKKPKKGEICVQVMAPSKEKGLRGEPHRLFFASESGYISIEIFKYIMDEFAKWWTSTRPGLRCYLISDNLAIHTNNDVVEDAKRRGIEMINIMAGSSHWFQVHDQLPFATLKKKFAALKNDFLPWMPSKEKDRRAFYVSLFFKAEMKTFKSSVVKNSFKDVGLRPWIPDVIYQASLEHSSTVSQDQTNILVDKVLDAVERLDREMLAKRDRIMSEMKCVAATFMKKPAKKKCRREDVSKKIVGNKKKSCCPRRRKNTSVPIEPPKKRRRVTKKRSKTCGAKGCQKTHFWSKKWVFCPKCKINFCPLHAYLMHTHKC